MKRRRNPQNERNPFYPIHCGQSCAMAAFSLALYISLIDEHILLPKYEVGINIHSIGSHTHTVGSHTSNICSHTGDFLSHHWLSIYLKHSAETLGMHLDLLLCSLLMNLSLSRFQSSFWVKYACIWVFLCSFVTLSLFIVVGSLFLLNAIFGKILSTQSFSIGYERAAECADDKIELRKLKESVQDDLKIPDIVSLECRHVLPNWSPPDNATSKYTDLLLATASGKVGENSHGKIATPFEKTKVAAYTLGAMAPWKRFHSFISNEIQAVLDPEDSSHNYKKWIDIYSSQEFEASTQLAEDLLAKLSISLTREELNVIENL